jgi:hypothetical protein
MEGSVTGGSSEPVNVAFDATGLEPGDHAATLCFESNDPVVPQLAVPVELTVIPAQLADQIFGDGFDGTGP